MANLDKAIVIMQQRAGKDKTIKIIQYTGRLALRLSETSQLKSSILALYYAPKIAPLVKELSAFRKVIKFGDWIKTWREMQAEMHAGKYPGFFQFVDLYNELADDLYLLAKIGTLDKKLTRTFERQSELAWFVSIIHGLWIRREGKGRIWKLEVSKLVCDFIFCYVDVFRPRVDSSVQTVAGLMSAILAYYKIWLKTK